MAIENTHQEPVNIYPWLHECWQQFNVEAMPQAILLHGQKGIGKFDFALELSQAILCEADLFSSGIKPCKQCQACRWFETGNHPDFIALLPQILKDRLPHAELEGLTKAEASGAEEKEGGEGKKESSFLRIDEVRSAIASINIGTHRGGRRVILIYPLESLRDDASNTLLKSLEEPSPDTIFILVSDRLDRVLATIRSRSQLIALPKPSRERALQWLHHGLLGKGDQPIPAEEMEACLDEQGGAPISARELILARHLGDDKEGLGLVAASTRILLEAMSKGRAIAWLECAEKVQKAPYASLLLCVQRWLLDLQMAHQVGELRYYRRYQKQILRLAPQIHLGRAQKLWKVLLLARRHENHPLSTRVQMESLLLQYQQLFED
jgi:DNA polymerase-3 subunit delta'